MNRRIIGITGGIATGKTAVSNYLSQHYQLPILDADVYARSALQGEIFQKVIARYRSQILVDGSFFGINPQNADLQNIDSQNIDRQKLGKIIFSNPAEKVWLESLIHPHVRDLLIRESENLIDQNARQNIVVMVIPLLFEAKMQDLTTEVWVVTCPYAMQLERLMQRNQLSQVDAERRIASQMPLSEKIALADLVLDNSYQDRSKLYQQIDRAIS